MFTLATLGYIAGAGLALRNLMASRPRRSGVPVLCALAGFVLHTLSLLWGWAATGHFPTDSAYHTLSFLAWGSMFLFLVSFRLFRQPAALVSFFLPVVVLFALAAVAVSFAPSQEPEDRAKWWVVHGILMLLGCGAFAFALVTSVMYLALEHQLKARAVGRLLRGLPSLQMLDRMNVLSIGFGFALFTLSMVAAAVGWRMENRPPGDWLRTPVGIVSAVTWFLYLCAVNARFLPQFRGKTVAYLTILGFALVLFALGLLLSVDVLHPRMGALGGVSP
jgi:ABC-type uncharacterized transport system permease subunit